MPFLAVTIPARLARLLMFVAVVMATGVAFAQQTSGAENIPSAPEPKQNQAQSTQKPEETRLQATIDVLARRSVFFPELAYTKGPLDANQKLELAVDETIAPSHFLGALFTSGVSQARGTLGYGQGWGAYGERVGSSVASNTSSHLFGTFLLPSVLHQDPRYFVKLRGNDFQRVVYAITRVVETRNDDGREEFNWSFVGGGMLAEGLATVYLPASQRTVAKTFSRVGVRMTFGALSNVVKEYWPDIVKSLRVAKMSPNTQPDPGTVTPPAPPPPQPQKPYR
jgi:hypothetical protein